MCTVTIVPQPDGFRRVVCNRDEQRSRPPALPPVRERINGRDALMPLDPAGGGRGTWIAANDARLVLLLVNRYPERHDVRPAREPGQKSRGLIIPRLIGAGSLDELEERVARVNPSEYALFRLLGDDGWVVHEYVSDGRELARKEHALSGPVMFTSCGLGDAVAEAPRRELFEQMFAGPSEDWLDAQQRYHCHRWPERPDVSVDMEREDAHTVSVTEVDLGDDRVAMRYRDENGEEHATELLTRVSAA